MGKYVPLSCHLSVVQRRRLMQGKCVQMMPRALDKKGGCTMHVTARQAHKLHAHHAKGMGLRLKMSMAQLRHNRRHGAGLWDSLKAGAKKLVGAVKNVYWANRPTPKANNSKGIGYSSRLASMMGEGIRKRKGGRVDLVNPFGTEHRAELNDEHGRLLPGKGIRKGKGLKEVVAKVKGFFGRRKSVIGAPTNVVHHNARAGMEFVGKLKGLYVPKEPLSAYALKQAQKSHQMTVWRHALKQTIQGGKGVRMSKLPTRQGRYPAPRVPRVMAGKIRKGGSVPKRGYRGLLGLPTTRPVSVHVEKPNLRSRLFTHLANRLVRGAPKVHHAGSFGFGVGKKRKRGGMVPPTATNMGFYTQWKDGDAEWEAADPATRPPTRYIDRSVNRLCGGKTRKRKGGCVPNRVIRRLPLAGGKVKGRRAMRGRGFLETGQMELESGLGVCGPGGKVHKRRRRA